ncbi:hypothetical protein [Saccharopolyspora gregorii]|uniref:hypothetical protein n=1 Tax=Saccharopolyspora gregorii TaxID=33914 RepID=UPI0031E50FC8
MADREQRRPARRGQRILDTTADGINLNGSARGVRVRNNFLRNTGDDSLAMWSLHAPTPAARSPATP